MNEKNKANLEALVGAEKAALLVLKIENESQAFTEKITDLCSAHTENMRIALTDMVNEWGSGSDDQKDHVLNVLRKEVLNIAACDTLSVAGALQAEAPVASSDYAHHALVHYEEGLLSIAAASALSRMIGSIGDHTGKSMPVPVRKDRTTN